MHEEIHYILIKYILYKEYPLSILSNYLNYKKLIKENNYYLNISAVYLSCKVEGMHLSIDYFRLNLLKFFNKHLLKQIELSNDEIIKWEISLIKILNYKFVFDCLFLKLFGNLILKGKSIDFEFEKNILINKILNGEDIDLIN